MRKILYLLLVIGLLAGLAAYKMYNKPHENMQQAEVDVKLRAEGLFQLYEESEEQANIELLGKTLQVTGKINAVNKEAGRIESIGLATGDLMVSVTCLLDEVETNHRQTFVKGEEVTFNCKCTGKLMDIELNRCVEVK